MFLLILEEEYKEYHALNFTFHYVSINTAVSQPTSPYLSFFTFHYVSINTSYLPESMQRKESLHSTMFLLIQRHWDGNRSS